MGLFTRQKEKIQDRVANEVERWRPARTKGGTNIGSVEAVYTVGVFALAVLLAGIAPKAAMAQLLIFGAAVVALSAQVKRMALPNLYDLLAPRFGWQDFDTSVKEETVARQAEQAAKANRTAEPVPAPASVPPAAAKPTALPETILAILSAYVAKSKAERRTFTKTVQDVLMTKGIALEGLDEADSDEERQLLADLALRRLAKANGIQECAA